jgi:hypothetical protein
MKYYTEYFPKIIMWLMFVSIYYHGELHILVDNLSKHDIKVQNIIFSLFLSVLDVQMYSLLSL